MLNSPSWNFCENVTANTKLLEIAIPGVEKEDVNITMENSTIKIIALRKMPQPKRTYVVESIATSGYETKFILDSGDVVSSAELHNGILTIAIEKARANCTKIPVK